MFLRIQLDIGAESLPGSQNCKNCYCLAPVRPAENARNRQKSKRQQINASKIIGAESLPGILNCTNCYCMAPVRPAANSRNRKKSKRQKITASKSDWICQSIPTGTQHSTQRQVPMDPLPTPVLWTLNHPAPTGTQPCGWATAVHQQTHKRRSQPLAPGRRVLDLANWHRDTIYCVTWRLTEVKSLT